MILVFYRFRGLPVAQFQVSKHLCLCLFLENEHCLNYFSKPKTAIVLIIHIKNIAHPMDNNCVDYGRSDAIFILSCHFYVLFVFVSLSFSSNIIPKMKIMAE